MLYLSSNYASILPQYRAKFGYMLNAMRAIGGEPEAVRHPWMLDNGIYGGKWQEATWLARIQALQPHRDTCIAVVVPDALYDLAGTLQRWQQYAPVVKQLGYKAAFVTQNGCTPGDIPGAADVLFVGGDDTHKLHDSWPLIAEAQRRNMWVHVGRVNSASRMRMFATADSCDGTHLSMEPSIERQRNIWRVSEELQEMKRQPELSFIPA